MNALPQLHSAPRTPRVHLENDTPAVLRFDSGDSVPAQLRVVSLTGGLLALAKPLAKGSQVRLMFLIGPGSVLAGAEMLHPVNHSQQPFRFLALSQKDRRKLESIIPLSVYEDITEPTWMKKLRVASDQRYVPSNWRRRAAVCAIGLIALGLAGAMYLRHLQVLR